MQIREKKLQHMRTRYPGSILVQSEKVEIREGSSRDFCHAAAAAAAAAVLYGRVDTSISRQQVILRFHF